MTQFYMNFPKFRKLAGCYTLTLPGCYFPAHKCFVKHFVFKRKISSTIACYFEEIYRPWGLRPLRLRGKCKVRVRLKEGLDLMLAHCSPNNERVPGSNTREIKGSEERNWFRISVFSNRFCTNYESIRDYLFIVLLMSGVICG